MLNSNSGSFNNFNNQNNQNGEDKPKANIRYGRIRSTDGMLEVGIWINQYGITGKMIIRQACGKDPSTGANIYENKSPMELPQGYLDRERMRLFIDVVEQSNYQNLDFQVGNNSQIKVVSEGNNVKITLTNTKTNDTRSISLEGTLINGKIYNAPLRTLISWMKIAYNKALTARISDSDGTETEEVPF